jgi:hypothetical protein
MEAAPVGQGFGQGCGLETDGDGWRRLPAPPPQLLAAMETAGDLPRRLTTPTPHLQGQGREFDPPPAYHQ